MPNDKSAVCALAHVWVGPIGLSRLDRPACPNKHRVLRRWRSGKRHYTGCGSQLSKAMRRVTPSCRSGCCESSSAVESCLGNSPRSVAQFALGRSVFCDEHVDTLPFHHRCRKVKRISTIRYRPVTVPVNRMKIWLSIVLCEARLRSHVVLDAIERRRSPQELASFIFGFHRSS